MVKYSGNVESFSINTNTSTSSTNSLGNGNQTFNVSFSTSSPPTPSNGCNESLKHNHEQKAVFHGMKSAFRMISTGEKGIDNPQVDEALRIAGNVGKAFLNAEDYEYVPEESEPYLKENFIDKYGEKAKIIETAIERAWKKIDSGNHKAGARIAVSLADHYLGFRAN